MNNPLPLTATLFTSLLGVCAVLMLVASKRLELPQPTWRRLRPVLFWVILFGLLWVSDYPAAWRVPEIVVYLAEISFSFFRIVLVTLTGAILFGSLVALLFLTRPKRR